MKISIFAALFFFCLLSELPGAGLNSGIQVQQVGDPGALTNSFSYPYLYFNASTSKTIPLAIVGLGSTTLLLVRDASSATLKISSTDIVGGGSGGTQKPANLHFSNFYLRPNDGIATTPELLYVGEDYPVINFRKVASYTEQTANFGSAVIPDNYSSQTLRLKLKYQNTNGTGNQIKIQVVGEAFRVGDSFDGNVNEFTLSYQFTSGASSTNIVSIASSAMDISSTYLQAGAILLIKVKRTSPTGTEGNADFRLLDVSGEWQ